MKRLASSLTDLELVDNKCIKIIGLPFPVLEVNAALKAHNFDYLCEVVGTFKENPESLEVAEITIRSWHVHVNDSMRIAKIVDEFHHDGLVKVVSRLCLNTNYPLIWKLKLINYFKVPFKFDDMVKVVVYCTPDEIKEFATDISEYLDSSPESSKFYNRMMFPKFQCSSRGPLMNSLYINAGLFADRISENIYPHVVGAVVCGHHEQLGALEQLKPSTYDENPLIDMLMEYELTPEIVASVDSLIKYGFFTELMLVDLMETTDCPPWLLFYSELDIFKFIDESAVDAVLEYLHVEEGYAGLAAEKIKSILESEKYIFDHARMLDHVDAATQYSVLELLMGHAEYKKHALSKVKPQNQVSK